MTTMTRSQYNLIADAVAGLKALAGMTPDLHQAITEQLADPIAGSSSGIKLGAFRDRCLGIRRGR